MVHLLCASMCYMQMLQANKTQSLQLMGYSLAGVVRGREQVQNKLIEEKIRVFSYRFTTELSVFL